MNKLPPLKELLDSPLFRKRIGMYIGQKDIRILKGFLDGVGYAIDVYEIDDGAHPLDGFNRWVADYYKIGPTAKGWSNLILERCEFDVKKSVDEFFILYDLFRSVGGN